MTKINFGSIAILSLLSGLPLTAGATEPDAVGKVIGVHGTVLVRTGSEDLSSASVPLKAGTYFHKSDVINTSSDGGVKLLFDDKTIVDLGPSTLFHVDEYKSNQGGDREVGLALPYGNFRVAVAKPIVGKGKFMIKTKTATMGVRGTVFAGSAGEGGLQMTTQSGAVAVTATGASTAKAVLVPANTGISVSSAGPGSVEKLSPSATNARMSKTEIKSTTFASNVTFNKNSAVASNDRSSSKGGDKGGGGKGGDKGKGGEKGGDRAVASSGSGSASSSSGTSSGSSSTSESSSGSSSTSATASSASPPSESAPTTSSTASFVSSIVVADAAAQSSATAAPLAALTNFAPPKPTVSGPNVVIPVGGLKQVTIQVTR